MAVLKTTSPVVLPFAPTETPRNTVPSSRASTAGVDTPVPRFALPHVAADAQSGRRSFERLPLHGLIRDQFPGANINDAREDCPCLFSNKQHIVHAIEPGSLCREPNSSLKRPAREGHSVRGPMDESQTLAGTGKGHGVLADNIAGPDHRNPDAAAAARLFLAVAAKNRDIVHGDAARFCNGFAQAERRP